MRGRYGAASVPIAGRVGATVDLLRGHVAVRDGEHALLLQHLHGPGRSAAVWRQRHGQPPAGQRAGPERRRHVLQLSVQVEFAQTRIRPGLAPVPVPGRGRGRGSRRRGRGRSERRPSPPWPFSRVGRRRAGPVGRRPQSAAAGPGTAARLFHDGTVEQVPTRHAGRPARTVRGPGTVTVAVASTPPAAAAAAAGAQARAGSLRAGVRLRLRGHVRARQTPRLQSRHQLLLFLGQKPAAQFKRRCRCNFFFLLLLINQGIPS